MPRRLSRGLLLSLVAAVCGLPRMQAAPRVANAAGKSSILQRYLAVEDPSPTQYRVLRHVNASNERFDSAAWMDVWIEADEARGLRYTVAGEGGSDYIRSHVFRSTLENERKLYATGEATRAAIRPENYSFETRDEDSDGLVSLAIKPRRKDVLLIDGSIFVHPADAELLRVEGRLSKSPSFWTRRVEIVQRYERIAGFRMPVALQAEATVLFAGRSKFRVNYEYESVNGQRVGHPLPRHSGAAVSFAPDFR
jgi:hypothetical protein